MFPGETAARTATIAKVMADAGLRQNGRWKRGSVDNPESGISKAARNEMTRAGLILDYLSDLVDEVIAATALADLATKSRSDHAAAAGDGPPGGQPSMAHRSTTRTPACR